MNLNEIGLLKVAEPVKYFLALGRPKFGQQFQNLSFAHG
jgi:hypothetical protein